MMRSIILIGYRGTGKSSAAKPLAVRCGMPAYDSDAEIERRSGKTIAEIFRQEGEPVFRDMEAAVIADILASGEPVVLATGGGAILRQTTRELLRRSGTVFWLTAAPDVIFRRMTGDPATASMRPSLTPLPMQHEIAALLAERTPLYAETAHHTIHTDTRTLDEIVDEIESITMLI